MYIRDLAVWADDSIVEYYQGGFYQRFHEHTCCVVEYLLSKLYRKVKTKDTAKLFFLLYHPKETFESKIEDVNGVVSMNAPFDFDRYNRPETTHRDKKRMIAFFMKEKIAELCTRYGWDFDPFRAAFDEMEEIDYQFVFTSKRSWTSPNKKFKVSLTVYYDIDELRAFASLYKIRSREVLREVFYGKSRPGDFILYNLNRDSSWISDTEFAISKPTEDRMPRFYADFSKDM